MKKKSGILKKIAVTGAITGVACAAVGTAFIEKFLSKNGIEGIIAENNLSPDEDTVHKTDEALSGVEFYKKTPCKELFTFNKYSKTLFADFYELEDSKTYVISCHGFTGMPSLNNIYSKHFYELGYNVLLPHLRAHGKSEHDYCTMGWLDRFDVIDWINYIIEKNHDAKIILHGVSMGAATVMLTTGENLPENVICCIEDCGYTTLWEQYSVQLKEMFNLPTIMLKLIYPIAKIKFGFSFKDVSPIEAVKKSKTPTLFIHGDKDDFVPFWMNYPLYSKAGCEKERLVIPGAAHAESVYLQPEMYWEGVTKFINKYL